jgi:predicted patatin/cPLA2 family phospholipase
MQMNPFDTIILSGGSVKGIALLGALQAVFDCGLLNDVHTYAGSSIGSIICCLLCVGYKPVEIQAKLCTSDIISKLNVDVQRFLYFDGAFSYHNTLGHVIDAYIIDKIGYIPTMKELKINHGKTLIATVANLSSNKVEYISAETYPEMLCTDAIKFSAALPFLFERMYYNGSEFVDGGFIDNFPITSIPSSSRAIGLRTIQSEVKPPDTLTEYFLNLLRLCTTRVLTMPEHVTLFEIPVMIQWWNFDLSRGKQMEIFSDSCKYMKASLKI